MRTLSVDSHISHPDSNFTVAVRCRGITPHEISAASSRHPRRRDTKFHSLFLHRHPNDRHAGEVLLLDPDAPSDWSHLSRISPSLLWLPNGEAPRLTERGAMEMRRFAFDAVFPPATSNAAVYEALVRPLVAAAGRGFNGTLFAYGQTGTGKSYTVLGESDERPGLCALAAAELLRPARRNGSHSVHLSFLELYNEGLRDLLRDTAPGKVGARGEDLEVIEHPLRGVCVPRLTASRVRSVAEVRRLLTHGTHRRTTAPTNSNCVSSRSHAIVQFSIRRRLSKEDPNPETDAECDEMCSFWVAKLSMVDLAGSERVHGLEQMEMLGSMGGDASFRVTRGSLAMQQVHQSRRREGSNINKSLLALGNCIKALGTANRQQSHGKYHSNASRYDHTKSGSSSASSWSVHVPYRDSKLTRLLKESLGGNTRTVMLATVSPSCSAFEETLSTLKYAAQARAITRPIRQNIVHDLALKEDEGEDTCDEECENKNENRKCNVSVAKQNTPRTPGYHGLLVHTLEEEVRSLHTQLQVAKATTAKMGLAPLKNTEDLKCTRLSLFSNTDDAQGCDVNNQNDNNRIDEDFNSNNPFSRRWVLYERTREALQELLSERAATRNGEAHHQSSLNDKHGSSSVSSYQCEDKVRIREILRRERHNVMLQERDRRIDTFLS